MQNSLQTTPLLTASYYGRVEVVALLLKGGADVTCEDVESDTEKTTLPCTSLVIAILNGHR